MVVLQWQAKGTESWLKCLVHCQHRSDHYDKSFPVGRENDDSLHHINRARYHSQLSTSSTMSKKCMPTLVYHRRKKNKPFDGFESNDCGSSAINAEDAGMTRQDRLEPAPQCTLDSIKTHLKHPNEWNKPKKSLYGSSSDENSAPDEVVLVDMGRVSTLCAVNDGCSLSISDLKCNSATFKNDSEDAETRPSSVSLLAEKIPQDMSERDICIKILRSQGLLDTVRTRHNPSSVTENISITSDNYCSISCKICACMGNSSIMLVCDSCDDAFHISCCDSQTIANGEWSCVSCLKKKYAKLKEKSIHDVSGVNEEKMNHNQDSESERNLGSLGLMFLETEPYMSKVRVGDEFQAIIPDWRGPCDDKVDLASEPLQMNNSNNIGLQEKPLTKPSKLSSIGNWIQCRATLEGIGEGVDGTNCAKWRRAPLFEVQTDKWECFRCVLWDPTHADCAVPQELSTEEVMRQLKYIELLRPRLSAKRRKLICLEKNDLQKHTLTLKHLRAAEQKKKTNSSEKQDTLTDVTVTSHSRKSVNMTSFNISS